MEPAKMLGDSRKTETRSPRFKALETECQTVGCISFSLCDLNATAGKILRHSVQVLDALFKQHEPLTFKIGYTHNPIWRWTNPTYGYAVAREKWSKMLCFHYSKEPYSAAMLEAALIEKYQSSSAA